MKRVQVRPATLNGMLYNEGPVISRRVIKRVEIGATAYEWLSSHRFVSEETIISVVINAPLTERKYSDNDHFQVTFRRRKNSKFVNITLWIVEKSTTFLVYKMHSRRI